MIIKNSEAREKIVGPMMIKEYKINPDFSLDLVEINGEHGKIKRLNEDRIYYILEGTGKFIIDEIENEVSKNDLIYVPKNTAYNVIGQLNYVLVCSPEFKAEDDLVL